MTYKDVEIGQKPTLAMIEEYIAEKGFELNAADIFDKYAKRGWTTKKRTPLVSVEAMVNAVNGIQVSKSRKEEKERTTSVAVYGRYNHDTCTAQWGYKIKYPDGSEKIERYTDHNVRTTANRMELQAVDEALNNFCIYSKISIAVESEYVKNVIDHNDNAVFYPKNSDLIKSIYYKLNGGAMSYTVTNIQNNKK